MPVSQRDAVRSKVIDALEAQEIGSGPGRVAAEADLLRSLARMTSGVGRLRRLSFTREGHMSDRVWEHPSQPFVNQSAPHLAGSMYANRNNNEDSTEEHHEITDAK
jgi:hypothetical protein